ncbi:MAG: Ig-like domain-containing protein, partial [Nannocystaceae bacterium]
ISQEIAHAYGLEHVDEPGDIMNPYNAGGDPGFLDTCIPIIPNNGQIYCNAQHAAECGGSGTSQNSYQELLTLFGASSPDNTPPTVSISSPSNGAMYAAGANFDVQVTASDDINVARVELYNGNELLGDDTSSPFAFPLQNVPAGEYPFQAIAYDDSDNSAMSSVVTVFVGDDDPTTGNPTTGDPTTGDPTTGNPTTGDPTTGTSGTSSGSDSGSTDDPSIDPPDTFGSLTDGETATATATASGTGLPPGYGDQEMDEGCACTTADADARILAPGLLLLLLALPRRRRRT